MTAMNLGSEVSCVVLESRNTHQCGVGRGAHQHCRPFKPDHLVLLKHFVDSGATGDSQL
jgi:hypothetical protein